MTASMSPNKACPVLCQGEGGEVAVLAFRHPLAGLQLVKGTIESGESAGDAALRELAEEAGIVGATIRHSLGTWVSGHQDQVWAIFLCEVPTELPAQWTHHAADDGGHHFDFFWHPLYAGEDPSQWHPLFIGALDFIRRQLGGEAP